jgi:hypothetical protein
MSDVNQYSIYCNTESADISGYGIIAPTTCYTDTSHDVVLTSVKLIKTISPDTVIALDDSPEKGEWQFEMIEFTIPSSSSTGTIINSISFPFDMYVWQMSISNSPFNEGDSTSLAVGPDTVIGYLVSDTNSGTNSMNVSDTVIANIDRGSDIGLLLPDGSVKEYAGRVVSFDSNTNTVIMEKNFVNSFPSPSYVIITKYPVRNCIFDKDSRVIVGNKGTRAKVIPANTEISVIYNYNRIGTDDIKVRYGLEFYFL